MATYWENSCSFGLRYVSWYKYLIVSLVFSHLGFWSGNLFLIAPFPDLCLLVPFQWRKENLNHRVHRSSGKLGEPRFPLERMDPWVEIFLSPLTTHNGFYLSSLINRSKLYSGVSNFHGMIAHRFVCLY